MTVLAHPDFLNAYNAKHVLHPMADPKAMRATPPVIIERGEGAHVFDTEGRRYLDCVASLWNVNVGHNRPEVKQAIVAQLDRIAYYSTFNGLSNPPSIELSVLLAELMAPEKMTKFFFSSGGSDAIESALKLARQYWKLEGKPERVKFISLRHGYHGVHFGGSSANGNPPFRRAFEPLMPNFFQVETPYLYRNPWSDDPEELAALCATMLEREIVHQGPDTVAAFLAEPVQGAGGLIVPPAAYWPRVREICDRHGVLLISDEVVTGFGRTGSLFGARGWGVAPDIMVLAKGINSGYVPLGATALNERVAAAWERDHPLTAVMHGYTYSGHPLACAAALACQKIVRDENLTGNAARIGSYFLERLGELKDKHAAIGDVRGRGLMIGIECVKDRKTKEAFGPNDPFSARLAKEASQRGALIRCNAGKIILSPPLIIDRAFVDEAVRILDDSFAATPLP